MKKKKGLASVANELEMMSKTSPRDGNCGPIPVVLIVQNTSQLALILWKVLTLPTGNARHL